MSNIEICCGAVVFTVQNSEIFYLLIKDTNKVIGFPKGHMEDGESESETAIREIFEESSLNVDLIEDFKEIIEYILPNGNTKRVTYFLAEYRNQIPVHNEGFEHNEYLILKYNEAVNLLSYDDTKSVLKRANDHIEVLNAKLIFR